MLVIAALVWAARVAAPDECTVCLLDCAKHFVDREKICHESLCLNECGSTPIQNDLCSKAHDSVCQADTECGYFTDCTDCGTCLSATAGSTTTTTTTTVVCDTPKLDPKFWSQTPSPIVVQGTGCTKHGVNCVSSKNFPATYAADTRDSCTIKVPVGSTLSVEAFDTEPWYRNKGRVFDDALPPVQHKPRSYTRGDYLTNALRSNAQAEFFFSGQAKCDLDGLVYESELPLIWKSDGKLWAKDSWSVLRTFGDIFDNKDTSYKNYGGWKICFAKNVLRPKSPEELAQNHLTSLEPLHCSRQLTRQDACEPNPDPVCEAILDSSAAKRDQLCFQANISRSNGAVEAATLALTHAQLRDRQPCKYECGLCNGFYKTTRPEVDLGGVPCRNDDECESNVCEVGNELTGIGKCKLDAADITQPPAEETTASTLVANPPAVPRDCPLGEWACNDGSSCIIRAWRCDNANDCVDESDEWDCPGSIDGLTGMPKISLDLPDSGFSFGSSGPAGTGRTAAAPAVPSPGYHGFEYTDASRAFFTAATGGAKVFCRANAFPGFVNVSETVVVNSATARLGTIGLQRKLSSDCADPTSPSYGNGGHINFGTRKACKAVVGPLTFLLRSVESYVHGTKSAWGLPGYGADSPSPDYDGDVYSEIRRAMADNIVLVCSDEGSLFVGRPTPNGYNPSASGADEAPSFSSYMDPQSSCNLVATLLNQAVGETPMELNVHERHLLERKKAIFNNVTVKTEANAAHRTEASSMWKPEDDVAAEDDDLANRDDDFWAEKQRASYAPDGDFRLRLWEGRTVDDWPDLFISDFFSDGFAPTSIWGASMKGKYRYDNITESALSQGWVQSAENLSSLTTLDKLELRMRWEIVSFLTEEDGGRDAFEGVDKNGQLAGFRHYAKQTFKELIHGFDATDAATAVTAAIAAARGGMISKMRGEDHNDLNFETFSAPELMGWADPDGPSGSGYIPRAASSSINEMRVLDLNARLSMSISGLDARLLVVETKVGQKDDNTAAVTRMLGMEFERNAKIQTLEDGASERDLRIAALVDANKALLGKVQILEDQMVAVKIALEDRRARAALDDSTDSKGVPVTAIVVPTVLAVLLFVAGAILYISKRTGGGPSDVALVDLQWTVPNRSNGNANPLKFGTEGDAPIPQSRVALPMRERNDSDSRMTDREVFSTKYVKDTSMDLGSGTSLFSFESIGTIINELDGIGNDATFLGETMGETMDESLPFSSGNRSESRASSSFDDSVSNHHSHAIVSAPLLGARSFGSVDPTSSQKLPEDLTLVRNNSLTSILSSNPRVQSPSPVNEEADGQEGKKRIFHPPRSKESTV